jgi:UDP-N-acetylglucosamine:LPS N-acetylglucosamine transferase
MEQPAAVSWQEMKLMIAGGGTGGHVFPALAIAEEWRRRSRGEVVDFLWNAYRRRPSRE